MTIKTLSVKKTMRYLVDVATIFCVLFEFAIGFGLTTSRIVALYALIYVLYQEIIAKDRFSFVNSKAYYLSLMMLSITFIIVYFNSLVYSNQDTDITYIMHVRYIIYVFLYVFLISKYYVLRFKNLMEFSKAYLGALFIQSFAIFLGAANQSIRVFLFQHTVFFRNTDEMLASVQVGSRVTGIGLMGAGGSLVLATGCILLTYLIINKYITNRTFIIEYVILSGATMLIGRTGFYLEIILIIVYLFQYRNQKKYFGVIAIASSCVIALLVFSMRTNESWMLSYYKRWLGEILNSDRFMETIGGIMGHGAVDKNTFSDNIFFGSNVLRGVNPSGGLMMADSGYLRMFNAIGIIGCLFYYGAFACSVVGIANRIKNVKSKAFYRMLIVVLFVMEFKEPFMMKYFIPAIVLTMGCLIIKEQKVGNINQLVGEVIG